MFRSFLIISAFALAACSSRNTPNPVINPDPVNPPLTIREQVIAWCAEKENPEDFPRCRCLTNEETPCYFRDEVSE